MTHSPSNEPAVHQDAHLKWDDPEKTDELEQVEWAICHSSGACTVRDGETEVFYPPQHAPTVIADNTEGEP